MGDPPILPGARVRNDAGLLGIVERFEPQDAGEGGQGYLIMRERDGERHYRLPLRLVRAVGEEGEHAVVYTVVHLQVALSDLGHYLIEDQAGPVPDDATTVLRLPLAAEHLIAASRPVLRGTVHLHKGIEIEEQVLMVSLQDEEVTVERIPAEQFDANAPPDPDETIIPVIEERLVVETRRVITEYVRVRKRRIARRQEVRGPVRREVITVTEEREGGTAAGDRPLIREV